LETAINFEIKRQKELWEKDEVPTGDITVGYDDISGKTYFMRSKEGSQDYRYFPEPDLPPLVLENDFIDQLRAELPEMPEQKYQRYVGELGLAEAEALFLVEDRDLNVFFDKVVEISGDSKKAASFVLSILVGRMKKDGRSFAEIKVEAEALAKLIKMVNDGGLSMNIAKGEVFEEMYLNGGDPEKIVEAKGLKSMSNEGELEEICQKVVAGNAKIVEDFKGGKDNAFKALMGLVMKETRGQANPVLVNKILNNLLQK
jgi:aspartyl-tRNA(Asn)/glutamyl-tRNA(Gln) amidotransferase subunit B